MMSKIVDDAFEAVERRSLSEQAYRQIRKALMVGELRPGQKLHGRDIAVKLGTSLTPVREALLQLVAEGALEGRSGQSVVVPVPNRQAFAELIRIRVQVEGLGAEQAAAVIEPEAIGRLAKIHDALIASKLARDYPKVLRCNEAFHLGLCREARMPRLLKVVESLWAQSGPGLNHLYDGPDGWPMRPDPHGHVQVLEALSRRDGSAARRAIADDIHGSVADMIMRLPE